MANLSVTAASVAPASDATTTDGTAGGTLTQGMPVYLDSSTNTYKAADANGTGTYTVAGITLNAASSGQPVRIQTGGGINVGATLTVGQVYVISATAGSIAPYGDLTTGDYVSILGVATTASNLQLKLNNSGVAKP